MLISKNGKFSQKSIYDCVIPGPAECGRFFGMTVDSTMFLKRPTDGSTSSGLMTCSSSSNVSLIFRLFFGCSAGIPIIVIRLL